MQNRSMFVGIVPHLQESFCIKFFRNCSTFAVVVFPRMQESFYIYTKCATFFRIIPRLQESFSIFRNHSNVCKNHSTFAGIIPMFVGIVPCL